MLYFSHFTPAKPLRQQSPGFGNIWYFMTCRVTHGQEHNATAESYQSLWNYGQDSTRAAFGCHWIESQGSLTLSFCVHKLLSPPQVKSKGYVTPEWALSTHLSNPTRRIFAGLPLCGRAFYPMQPLLGASNWHGESVAQQFLIKAAKSTFDCNHSTSSQNDRSKAKFSMQWSGAQEDKRDSAQSENLAHHDTKIFVNVIHPHTAHEAQYN